MSASICASRGRTAQCVYAILVHETGEQVADLDRIVTGDLAGGAGLDDLFDLLLGLIGKGHEGAPTGAIAGDFASLEPSSIDVAE